MRIELPALLCDMVYSLSLHDICRFRDGLLFILGIFFVAGCFSLFCFSFSFHLRAVGMEWRVFSLRFDTPDSDINAEEFEVLSDQRVNTLAYGVVQTGVLRSIDGPSKI